MGGRDPAPQLVSPDTPPSLCGAGEEIPDVLVTPRRTLPRSSGPHSEPSLRAVAALAEECPPRASVESGYSCRSRKPALTQTDTRHRERGPRRFMPERWVRRTGWRRRQGPILTEHEDKEPRTVRGQ
eukprot:scaffold1671_cov344-Pavlova_lutheri.AAC.32